MGTVGRKMRRSVRVSMGGVSEVQGPVVQSGCVGVGCVYGPDDDELGVLHRACDGQARQSRTVLALRQGGRRCPAHGAVHFLPASTTCSSALRPLDADTICPGDGRGRGLTPGTVQRSSVRSRQGRTCCAGGGSRPRRVREVRATRGWCSARAACAPGARTLTSARTRGCTGTTSVGATRRTRARAPSGSAAPACGGRMGTENVRVQYEYCS